MLLGAVRDQSWRYGIQRDLQIFDLMQRSGTPKGEAIICDPRAEIEVGCQAVLYGDGSAVLATVEHITPKQWVLRFGKEPSEKRWKENTRLLRVVATLKNGVRRAYAP